MANMEKTIRTRILHKIDSVTNWLKQSSLIPKKGEIVIAANDITNNNNADPYTIKIGDGTHKWNQIPCIGPNIFTGVDCNATNLENINDANLQITLPIGCDQKVYAKYDFNSEEVTNFTINVTGNDYMLTEHYILLNNKKGEKDRSFDTITIAGVDSEHIFSQFDYVPKDDIMELKISLYKIGNDTYATVTSKAGLDFRTASTGGDDETLDILTR